MAEIACISELWVRVFVVCMYVCVKCVLIKWHAASMVCVLWRKTFFINMECSTQLQALRRGCIREGGLTVTVTENSKRKRKQKYILHSYQWWWWWVRGFCVLFFSEYWFFALLYAVLSGSYISVVAITLTQFAVWCFLYTKGKSVSEWNSGCGLLLLLDLRPCTKSDIIKNIYCVI